MPTIYIESWLNVSSELSDFIYAPPSPSHRQTISASVSGLSKDQSVTLGDTVQVLRGRNDTVHIILKALRFKH